MVSRMLLIVTAAAVAVGIAISAQRPGPAEQALINDLVIANRILSSDELSVLRVYGHVSARSRRNPDRFYIARNVLPAFVTARDIIENDLDAKAVSGNRTDQYEEALGRSNAILLTGHGAVVVSASVPAAVSAANSLKRGAQLQMQMIAMGGKINPNPREYPEGRVRASAQPVAPAAARGGGGGLDTRNNAGDRAWDHWRRVGARMVQTASIATPAQPSDPVEAVKRDLAIASRILSSPQIGIMDTAGHISVRNPKNPNH